jgi:hypothetical protein
MSRICDECGSAMSEGYCIDSGCEYYCSDACLHKHYTPEEWTAMYADGDGDSYYTEWEEDEEDDDGFWPFVVLFQKKGVIMGAEPSCFKCYATDSDHAAEVFKAAYPDSLVLDIHQSGDPQAALAHYRAALLDPPGGTR